MHTHASRRIYSAHMQVAVMIMILSSAVSAVACVYSDINKSRRCRFRSVWSSFWDTVLWLLDLIEQRVLFSDQCRPVVSQTQTRCISVCVCLFLRFDQTLPIFVWVASYWSEGTKYNTVLTLLHSCFPPFPFDLHSRKRSLYFDFYIRYLIQLLFCPPYFLSSIWLEFLAVS